MEIIKELNGKKYIVYCCDRCGKIVEGVHTCPPNPVIEQLRQRVQELEEERKENKQLQASFDAQCVSADKLFDECAELRQRVAELEKERDKELARNRPLRNLIASLEEQKSHWNKQRDEYREAVATLDSERAANAKLTAERDALKQQRDTLVEAATMAVEMIEYDKHERRHVRWKLQDAIASLKEK